ncbi:hypothetical protein BGP_6198 [Beggiatoa sp. PS]|nr:hypothetical protein BGP_6198 [Beggiatoa sp. PS]
MVVKSSRSKLDRLPSSDGILPLKLLPKSKYSNLERTPNSGGITPFKSDKPIPTICPSLHPTPFQSQMGVFSDQYDFPQTFPLVLL